MIKLATLFSGIGAIEQTFIKMGIPHEIKFACDNGERELPIGDDAMRILLADIPESERETEIVRLYNQTGRINQMEKSYKANYHINDNDFYQDIRFLNADKYAGDVDIIVGGSPCQAFSCNGKRGGLEDTRGTLFYEYARIIRQVQPKCFIFENVKGMVTHDGGRTWETVKNVFQELNYHIYIHHDDKGKESPVLNAADYGIPQLRMRLYIIGIRNDITLAEEFHFPKPMKLETTVNDYLDDAVPAKYYLGKKGFEFVTTHPTRAQVGIPVMTCQKANQQFNWNGTFIFEPLSKKHTEAILQRAFIGEWKGVRGVIRMFTPRECLRLMGFLDSFRIVVNDTMMWRQCGNSIVTNVLEKIMIQLIKTKVFENA